MKSKGTLDDMQFGFTSGKRTTDAICIHREADAREIPGEEERAVNGLCEPEEGL